MQESAEPKPAVKENPASCGVSFKGLGFAAGYTICRLMEKLPNRPTICAALALAFTVVAAPVHAVEVNRRPVTILSPAEIQNLNSRERRFDYQQRQQFNRELDSQAIQRQPRLQVPVMKQRCPLQTSGTARTC